MRFFFSRVNKSLLIVALFFLTGVGYAQCAGCTVTITNSTSSYTASAGQVLCIASGLTYTGTVVLDGGTLCNSGTIKNITFKRGTFSNYGTYTGGNLSLAVTGNLIIDCYHGSSMSVGSFVYTSSSSYQTNITIFKGAIATFTSDLTQNAGILNFTVNRDNPSSNPVNTSTLNFNALLTSKRDNFSLFVYEKGSVTINNIASLEGTGVKSITNYGTVKFNRDLNIISSGNSTSTVTINNYKQMDLLLGLNASYTAGKVFINNNLASSIMNIASSISLSKTTNTLNNLGTITITQNFNLLGGAAINSGTIINNTASISGGTLTNNNWFKSNADFLITNTVTSVNNNGYLNVIRDFNNQSTINLAIESLIQTKNYYNLGNTGIINGPSSYIDTALYANILISDYSENTGYVNGYVAVYDQSIVSNTTNIGYGFDQITNPARIAAIVLFGAKAVGPGVGNPAVIACPILKKSFYSVQISANPNPVCPGQPVQLTSQLVLSVLANGPPSYYIVLPVTGPPTVSYSWLPAISFANPNLQNQTVSPLVTTNYVVSVSYNNCLFTANITVNVHPAIIANAGPDKPFVSFPGNFVQIGGSPAQTGGTAPFTYNWSPNLYFTNASNNTQPNPFVNPPVNTTYILTVTDSKGCIGVDQMDVYVLDAIYAVLAKNPDGGFYDITTARNPNYAGKLNFKFEEEYVANANNLDYKVYNMNRQLILTIPALSVVYKDNRYSINLTALAPFNTNLNSYYVLEVTDKKGEKTFLRFKY